MSLLETALSYTEYLESDEWDALREQVRKRSKGLCERHLESDCPRKVRAVNVHHLTYRNIGHEELEELLHVCRGCHEYLEGLSVFDPAAHFWLNNKGQPLCAYCGQFQK